MSRTNNPLFEHKAALENVQVARASTLSTKTTLLKYVALVVTAVFIMSVAIFIVVFSEATGDEGTAAPAPEPTVPPTPLPTPEPTEFPTSPPVTDAPTASPTEGCEFPLGVEIRGSEDDYVGVIFTGCPSPEGFAAFTDAAVRWSSFILTNQIIPVNLGVDSLDVNQVCGFLQPFVVEGLSSLDHLVVIAETVEIDGPGGVLASAGACLVDPNFVPIFGGMRFDNADLAVEELGLLEDVVLHEMGHILGLNRFFFRETAQGGGPAETFEDGMIRDPVFDEFGIGTPGNKPQFVGDFTVGVYSGLTGEAETGVPLEDGLVNGTFRFNITRGEGRGSIDSHWDKDVFDNELMTFALDFNDEVRPLSAITIGALQDLGYDVDLSLADDYSLPSRRRKANLRGKESDTVLSLENDTPAGWDESMIKTPEQMWEVLHGKQ